MLTGLPPYSNKTPIRCDATCGHCRRRYTVYNGADVRFDRQAEASAREYATERGRVFVDSRLTPFLQCVSCGALLDFGAADSCELVM